MVYLMMLLASLGSNEPLVFEADSFRYVLSRNATSVAFVDKTTGQDYCDNTSGIPFAVWIDERAHPASSATLVDGQLVVQFTDASRQATFRVTPSKQSLVFELVSLSPASTPLRELQFATIPLTLKGTLEEPFAVSPLALNIETYCPTIPGYTATLPGVKCFEKLGMVGAAVAIVGCPSPQLRDALKDAITGAPGIPQSSNGGPWAMDSPINQQSYFLDTTGKVNEQTVSSWIDMLNALGIKQLDLHGGYAFRFGDYMPNPAEYPNGRESLKAVVNALHDAGIAAGLHTYAMFIAKDTPWVTPIPDPGLAKNAQFTLATDLTTADTTVPVLESTELMSPLTGFHHRNSATIQIDDELIVFSNVSKIEPYAFTECTRGAYGTAIAFHDKGANVYHLKECFGLFAPDPESDLFHKVIAETAKTYNECGFDMMYMDALDGSDVLDVKAGGEFGWYYAAKFTYELMRQLKKPPLMEMSTFGHHLWAVRSRMGAWDACQRAPHTFADIHVLSNNEWRKHFLPTNLGWWGVFPWSGVQPKRSLPEDVEYICAKALGTNSSLSLLLGFNPATYPTSDNQQRLGSIIQRYENLRLQGSLPESIRDQLAKPGQAFHLDTSVKGTYRIRPAAYLRHDVNSSSGAESWTVDNPFSSQLPSIRIETQLSAHAYDSEKSAVIEDFGDLGAYNPVQTPPGVTANFTVVSNPTKVDGVSAAFTAKNDSADRYRSWATVGRMFDPPIDLNNRGLGLWIHGDGKGEILNIQIRSPKHVTFALTEHYVRIDFSGWRYVELIESEDYTIEHYEWPYSVPRSEWEKNLASAMSFAYPVYHAHLNYGQIGELHIAVNDIPPGEEIQVYLSPIRSVRHRIVELRNPGITINGTAIAIPVALESGQMLELVPPRSFTLLDKDGEQISSGVLDHDLPQLHSGPNAFSFTCLPPESASAHARITVTAFGDPLVE
ncbi:MAG: hypothetical protein AMXMBFR84_35390 [Candidatus Hydrogenedentota bacterium]